MDQSRIRTAFEELDREVPNENAQVLLEQYGGGPDESRIVATRSGLMRFGIELLRAGVDGVSGTINLASLVHSDSDIGFDSVEIRERLEEEAKDPAKGKFAGTVLFVAVLVVVAFAIYGVISLARHVVG